MAWCTDRRKLTLCHVQISQSIRQVDELRQLLPEHGELPRMAGNENDDFQILEVTRGSRSTDADFILVHADAHKHNVAETTAIILDENKRRAREFRNSFASTRAVSSSKLSSGFLSTLHNSCWISGVPSTSSLLLGDDWLPTVTRCSSVSTTAEQRPRWRTVKRRSRFTPNSRWTTFTLFSTVATVRTTPRPWMIH